jgi:hypothetical protein
VKAAPLGGLPCIARTRRPASGGGPLIDAGLELHPEERRRQMNAPTSRYEMARGFQAQYACGQIRMAIFRR